MKKTRAGKGYIDCFKCSHFFITWEPAFPRGCRAMGFKSRYLPSIEVFKASGIACQKFKEKRQNFRKIR